jgi:hypothetical protein
MEFLGVAAVQVCRSSKKGLWTFMCRKSRDKITIIPPDNNTQEDKYSWMANGIII